MRFRNILEKERSIRRHRSTDSQSEPEEPSAKPEEGRGERREEAEYRGEKEGEIEGWRTSFRVGIWVYKVNQRYRDCSQTSTRTGSPAGSSEHHSSEN